MMSACTRDLIHRLEAASEDAAKRLRRAKDRSIAETGSTLALRASGIVVAIVLKRPHEEVDADVKRLLRSYIRLEFAATRSRLPIADRAAITIARALADQVSMALGRQQSPVIDG